MVKYTRIKDAMQGRTTRINELVETMGISADTLKPYLTEENGFAVKGKGWIKLKKK